LFAGPSQPDADDYGYESQAASALYNELMNKYNSSSEKPIFNTNEKRIAKDIASTKVRNIIYSENKRYIFIIILIFYFYFEIAFSKYHASSKLKSSSMI
jgi:hypothetical protein